VNYRVVVFLLAGLMLSFLVGTKAFYYLYPNSLSYKPSQIGLIRENTTSQLFIDRNSKDGEEILKRSYGSYTGFIEEHQQVDISTPSSAEFTLPHVRYNNEFYLLREHPALRYHLWQHQPPDVVLLGSSVFFSDFNRETFFRIHPDVKLLDFTTGNNTPFIASYLLHYADSIGLKFKPGTLFIYGMNRNEMLASYKDRNAHDHVKKAIRGEDYNTKPTVAERISKYLSIEHLKYDLTSSLVHVYSRLFRGSVYRTEIDEQYLKDARQFRQYLLANAEAGTDSNKSFDEERVREMQKMAALLQKHDCSLVIVQMPLSSHADYEAGSYKRPSYFDKNIHRLMFPCVSYIDLSDHTTIGITDLDYMWPGKVFDPEHLSFEGADKFTRHLVSHVIDPALKKKIEKP
jgi:hypothetical protein